MRGPRRLFTARKGLNVIVGTTRGTSGHAGEHPARECLNSPVWTGRKDRASWPFGAAGLLSRKAALFRRPADGLTFPLARQGKPARCGPDTPRVLRRFEMAPRLGFGDMPGAIARQDTFAGRLKRRKAAWAGSPWWRPAQRFQMSRPARRQRRSARSRLLRVTAAACRSCGAGGPQLPRAPQAPSAVIQWQPWSGDHRRSRTEDRDAHPRGLLGQCPSAGGFNRHVAAFQARLALRKGVPAPLTPVRHLWGQACPGKRKVRSGDDSCNRTMACRHDRSRSGGRRRPVAGDPCRRQIPRRATG